MHINVINALQLVLSNVHSPCLIKNEKKKIEKNKNRDTNKINLRKKKTTTMKTNSKYRKPSSLGESFYLFIYLFCI